MAVTKIMVIKDTVAATGQTGTRRTEITRTTKPAEEVKCLGVECSIAAPKHVMFMLMLMISTLSVLHVCISIVFSGHGGAFKKLAVTADTFACRVSDRGLYLTKGVIQ